MATLLQMFLIDCFNFSCVVCFFSTKLLCFFFSLQSQFLRQTLTKKSRLALNLGSSCLPLPSAGTLGLLCHAQQFGTSDSTESVILLFIFFLPVWYSKRYYSFKKREILFFCFLLLDAPVWPFYPSRVYFSGCDCTVCVWINHVFSKLPA